ncbi:hypothetical protein [Aureispira sp. CCB-E]|uniref:hypothetical protein n=1 Tax=Aureispira sp. CCB-E TaxID=3051121 RepID=UPI0028688F6C|nr:hypothetical protein [Aureispira sp. CCB-E]WMX12981.1 hypothetical protein QP953_19265 [Aureispira sp. CCB-E]
MNIKGISVSIVLICIGYWFSAQNLEGKIKAVMTYEMDGKANKETLNPITTTYWLHNRLIIVSK